MYSTCIFCGSGLGRNESIEHFPVGRRLAFDAEKGRLWVVCASCSRWNLTPLEERWEAVEECERRFRATTIRTSTENIGLARLPDETELVRIGRPLRPEFAAWRYGGEFAGRQRRAVVSGLALAGAVGGFVAFGAPSLLVGLPVLAAAELWKMTTGDRMGYFETLAAQGRLRDDAGELMLTGRRTFKRVRLQAATERARGTAWALHVRTGIEPVLDDRNLSADWQLRDHVVSGAQGLRALAVFLARANGGGAGKRLVQQAVKRIDRARTAEGFLARAEDDTRRMGLGYRDVWDMPVEIRLAMEMAAHEDAERRALEGELVDLERHWREAEDLAAIADALPIAPAVEAKLDGLRASAPKPKR
ncbi:hypothetical protein [Longimicrobium sp.]|uniref:hypothetical protein n=1 Tax=Longimicrobium sp. TaxID=2029185 RepID=UPI003B3A70E7